MWVSVSLVSPDASKHAPTLRPPTAAMRPSAIQALSCMRRLTLKKRGSSSTPRSSAVAGNA
ncbi:hypothetical protein XthCFBP4691_13005 [Xanthomonas theicola]|uniref:Uncharacterized protein n=1 Tax=Xanthomonas theicola TaxID=56464 RepID=A0A2S6ZDH6_9XANT|nr:hypothetical protein XthCFBP4691_13005 [Xanthomonas theicola]